MNMKKVTPVPLKGYHTLFYFYRPYKQFNIGDGFAHSFCNHGPVFGALAHGLNTSAVGSAGSK